MELVAECRPFEAFRVRLLAPDTEEVLDERLVDRLAQWDELPGDELASPEILVHVSATGWRDERRRVAGGGSIEIAMEPLSVLAGNAVDAVTGEPLEAFRLRLEHADEPAGQSRTLFAHRSVAIEDPVGAFRMGGLPLDGTRLRLVAEAPGYLPEATEWFAPGVWIEGLVIALASRAAGLARIGGMAVDPGGEPVEGAQVVLALAEAEVEDVHVSSLDDGKLLVAPHLRPGFEEDDFARLAEGGEQRALSGADGRFDLATQEEGELRLFAFHPSWGLVRGDAFETRRGERVQAPVLAFAAAASLRVTFAGEDGLLRVRVEVRGPEGSRWASVTAEEGARFAGLAPGSYEVSVSEAASVEIEPGVSFTFRMLATASVELGPEGETVLAIDLAPEDGTQVAGVLLPPEAERSARWRWQLQLVSLSEERALGVSVAEDGTFVIENVPPGSYAIAAMGFDGGGARFGFVWRRLQVQASAAPPFLELTPRGRVEVHDPRLDVAGEGTLELEPADEALAAWIAGRANPVPFDAGGTSVWYGLPAGRVTFSREGRAAELEVPGEPISLRVVLGE